jgi:hypothetical protein
MQKRNEEGKECEKKKKKKTKGKKHIKGCESQDFKSIFRSTMKRSYNKILKDYRRV